MTFEELINQVKAVPTEELRSHDANSLEAVFSKTNLAQVISCLNAYFGKPLKPEGEAPSMEASGYAAPYGGVRRNQTMYFQTTKDQREVALLWPWGSGQEITVRMIRE